MPRSLCSLGLAPGLFIAQNSGLEHVIPPAPGDIAETSPPRAVKEWSTPLRQPVCAELTRLRLPLKGVWTCIGSPLGAYPTHALGVYAVADVVPISVQGIDSLVTFARPARGTPTIYKHVTFHFAQK